MTIHDAAMTCFAQWWRRSQRAGYAFAEGAQLHGAHPEYHWVREARGIVIWGGLLPVCIVFGTIFISPLTAMLFAIYGVQLAQIYVRERATKPVAVLEIRIVRDRKVSAGSGVDAIPCQPTARRQIRFDRIQVTIRCLVISTLIRLTQLRVLQMPRVTLLQQIKEDYIANYSDWTRPGFRALAIYRLGAWFERTPGIAGKLARRVVRFLYRRIRNRYGIEIPASTTIGRRLIVEHQSGIVVHGSCVIGDDCIIRQGVTIGNRRLSEPLAAPRIGNRVNIGAGAAILGALTIGDDAQIGANAVVITDVPIGAVVVTPAHADEATLCAAGLKSTTSLKDAEIKCWYDDGRCGVEIERDLSLSRLGNNYLMVVLVPGYRISDTEFAIESAFAAHLRMMRSKLGNRF